MSFDFAAALEFTLDHEGRIVENVSGDPGGLTKDGITTADYDNYRREHGLPEHSVIAMTPEEELAIYREHYAVPVHFDDLPYDVGLSLFDAAVNVGAGRVVVWLQKVLGVSVDGAFGPDTLAAANQYISIHGHRSLAEAILTRRRLYYGIIGAPGSALSKFYRGWVNRCDDLQVQIEDTPV